jgi:hypothetical protein
MFEIAGLTELFAPQWFGPLRGPPPLASSTGLIDRPPRERPQERTSTP